MTREQTVQACSMTWLGIVNHTVISLLKTVVGILFNSPALLAGGLYSAADAATVMIQRIEWLSPGKGARSHSANRQSIKLLAAIIVSVFLLLGTLELVISVLSRDDIEAPGFEAGVAIVIALAIKEAVFQFQYRWWRKRSEEDTRELIEMHRFSFYTSIIVMIGIFGSIAGEAWGLSVFIYLDTVASLLAACLIVWRVYLLLKLSINPSKFVEKQEDTTSFIETVQRVHGIIRVDDLKALERGHYVTITAKVSVNPRLTVQDANVIANRAKVLLINRFSHVSEVSIFVLPYDPGYPYKSNHDEASEVRPTLLQ